MQIIYDSKTGNVKRFADKLPFGDKQPIHQDTHIDQPFILITYTTGFGNVPESTEAVSSKECRLLGRCCSKRESDMGGKFCEECRYDFCTVQHSCVQEI